MMEPHMDDFVELASLVMIVVDHAGFIMSE
jgi:hypothetical protein